MWTACTSRTIDVVSLAGAGRRPVTGQVPDYAERHLARPRDPDDLVAALRFAIAWRLDCEPVEVLAARARVEAARIVAFMRSPARRAGDLLTLAEVARLARVLEERLVDRDVEGEGDAMRALAEVYIEEAAAEAGDIRGCYRRALRTARARRRVWRRRRGIDVQAIGQAAG